MTLAAVRSPSCAPGCAVGGGRAARCRAGGTVSVMDLTDADLAADLAYAKAVCADAQRVVVLTGAGVSVGAGLPTYRGPGGLWTQNPDAEARSTPPPAKMCDPSERRAWWDRLWTMWGPLRATISDVGPAPAHHALATWGQRRHVTVVTTNVDGLHAAAGSEHVVELHGNVGVNRCSKRRCSQQRWADDTPRDAAPDCPRCGRPARPDVVLFGEALDRNDVAAAHHALAYADLCVVVGTSGSVWPACELPAMAERAPMPVLYVDPGTWRGPHVNWVAHVAADADDVLAELVPND